MVLGSRDEWIGIGHSLYTFGVSVLVLIIIHGKAGSGKLEHGLRSLSS